MAAPKFKKIVFSLLFLWNISINLAVPVVNSSLVQFKEENTDRGVFYDHPVNVTNVTFVPKDLIVIRTYIYEVGYLTNADPNVKDDIPQIEDEINLKTFQPPKNITVNWFKTFEDNDTDINSTHVAFKRVVPVGETVLPKEEFDITLDETEEEEEESYENVIDLL